MPVLRTFLAKVKPGRMQDVVPQLSTFKRVVLESGAMSFHANNVITGPIFPGIGMHATAENFATYGEVREKVLQHPEGLKLFDEDSPITIVNAVLAEGVYRAGSPVLSILDQTKVRFSFLLCPKRGRGDDVLRRASRLADTVHECGALAVSVRRVIAGTDGPRMGFFSYHPGFAEFEATRNAVMESDVWNALNRSQDEAAVRMTTTIAIPINL